MLPENADYFVELLACAFQIASGPMREDTGDPISDDLFRQWANSAERMSNVPGFGGDPHEGLFVAEIPFGGGSYRTLPSEQAGDEYLLCLLYTSPSPRDATLSRMPSSA